MNLDPSPEQLAQITLMSADVVRRFGLVPKVALLSHSNFGSRKDPSAMKMREVLALLRDQAPSLDVDGEMHGDVALNEVLRRKLMPETTLSGTANLHRADKAAHPPSGIYSHAAALIRRSLRCGYF